MPEIYKVNNINAEELKVYTSLTESQLKTDNGLFIAESVKVIDVALDKGLKPVSFLMEERQIEGIGKDLIKRCPNIPVYTASRQVLKEITGFELTRGVLCAMERPAILGIDDVLKDAKRIAVKYTALVENAYETTGHLWEKYNVVSGNTDVCSENYGMPVMMGWTAGAYLSLKNMI